jgi:hypothetical protein
MASTEISASIVTATDPSLRYFEKMTAADAEGDRYSSWCSALPKDCGEFHSMSFTQDGKFNFKLIYYIHIQPYLG